MGRVAFLAVVLTFFAPGLSRVDAAYDVYVGEFLDGTSGRILRADPTGNVGVFADAGLVRVGGLAFDAQGRLYAASIGDNTVHVFSSSGQDLGVFASTNLSEPYGLVFDPAGNLYVSNDTNEVSIFSPSGAALGSFYGGSTPTQMVFDSSGNLNVTELNGSTVFKFSPTGSPLGALITGLNTPYGLAIDGAGRFYVSELFTNTIRLFSSTGQDLGVFASAGLSNPSGLAFDGDGNLYVANNNQGHGGYVRKFSGSGEDLGVVVSGLTGATFLAVRPAAVPEPGGLAVLGTSLFALACFRGCRKLQGKASP